ncbi:hypothetical protein H6P81_013072 [Aristolochia fimbriata]|uniref:Beta-glucosidase n=1 Tax=Aristolochia fimbriata TaxID=158543 RepID=A0AAV7EE08_ARIFI|nr:hypothetical protein H6P81_013072 [Aristolochia fimbriata]
MSSSEIALDLHKLLVVVGIQSFATLYHWDLPAHLQELIGGWLSEKIVKYFAIYAETCFAAFGDRVKHWITINEPLQVAVNGHGIGIFAPGRKTSSLIEPYLATHNQLLAHAAAVAVYREKFQVKQGGQIGIAVVCEWAEAFSDEEHNKSAADRYLDPIYHGDYPPSMREGVGKRLPVFSDEDKELLQNSVDFLGTNINFIVSLTLRLPLNVSLRTGTGQVGVFSDETNTKTVKDSSVLKPEDFV